MEPDKVRAIIEAILLTADAPVSPGKLQSLLKEIDGRDIRRAVDELNEQYRIHGHAMSVVEVAGGFQVATRSDYGPWVRKFHDRGHVRLSQAALETLAIVAFKQPITRVEIDSIRGVDSGGVMRTLLEVNMIRIVGRSEGVGRPMLFGTTRDFMTHFGLKSLADLPKPKELEELLAEGERQARAAGGDTTAPAGEAGPGQDAQADASDDDILGPGRSADTEGVDGEPDEETTGGAADEAEPEEETEDEGNDDQADLARSEGEADES